MDGPDPVPRHTRRSFLDLLLGIGVVGWLVSAVFPVLRFLKPLPSSGASGPIRLSPEEVAKVGSDPFLILRAGSKSIMVFRDESDEVRAVSARCTHEGCTVQFVPDQSVIWCACHNARFDLDGSVLSGPPPKPLPEYEVHQEFDGGIVVGVESMSTPKPRASFLDWLDSRYQIKPLLEFVRHKEVPIGSHSMVWYYLGGMTLFFFTVQIISGILLLMYYQAGENTSYESIRYITTKVPFGWLMRSVHCWSAHLMIVSLIVHMFSTMFLKAYRPPREVTWVTGFFLFAVSLAFGFSGYLLPWNELAFFATVVGTETIKSVPLVGDWLLHVMRGGPDVTINTLYRFFALHVVILPMAIFAIIGIHLLLIQRQGMAPPQGLKKAPRGMKFFPSFALRDVLLWLICLIGLMSLAVFLPYGPGVPGVEWELGLKADPLAPAYPGIKPEWYFLWVYQLLKEFPPHFLGLEGPQAALVLVTGLLGIWAFLPWLDRRARKGKPSAGFTDLGVGALMFVGYLTLKAWDIGGNVSEDNPLPDPVAVARTTGYWMLGAFAVVTFLRMQLYRTRWFLNSGAVALHIVLHGLVGLSYLTGGMIALGCAIVLQVVGTRLLSATARGGGS